MIYSNQPNLVYFTVGIQEQLYQQVDTLNLTSGVNQTFSVNDCSIISSLIQYFKHAEKQGNSHWPVRLL